MLAEVNVIEDKDKESFAIEAFKEYRLETGIDCKKCGGHTHYWLKSKLQFQCKRCKFRTTLRSGTFLEGSKLPLYYFFIAVHLIGRHGNLLTVEEFQSNTLHKYYDPLWDFLNRIKKFILEQESQKTILRKYADLVNGYLQRNH